MTPDQMRRMRMRRMNLLMAYASFAASRAAASTALFGDGTAGGTLLGATETDGLAVDFTAATPDLLIRDAASTLNYSGTPFLNDGGKLTFSRTSLATVVDDDGLIKWSPHNILVQSADFTTTWANSNTTDSANTIAAPDGTTTADTIAASAANGTILQTYTATANQYTFGVWLKRKTGTGDIEIAADSGTWTAKAITADWALYTVSQTPAAGSKTAGIRIVTSGDEVYAWGAHLYRSDLGGMQDNGSAFPTYNPTTSAAYYGPRIDHDPVTLAKRGLLMEEARTNLLEYSEQLNDASWTLNAILAFGSGSVANATTAPSGETTADLIVPNTSNTNHSVLNDSSVTGAVTYTQSIYAKAAGYTWLQITESTGFNNTTRANINLADGSLGAVVGYTASTLQVSDAGDGWWRISVTNTASSTTATGRYLIIPLNANTDSRNPSYAGDGTSGVYLWGAQLEAGAFPTSYIPTTTASVTRAVDANTAAVTLFPYSATEGTLFAEFTPFNVAAARRAVEMNDTTANERVTLGSNATPNGLWTVIDGGASQAAIATGTPAANTTIKMAARWKANDFALSVNGAAASTDTSGTLPTMTTLRIGSGVSNAEPINGHIRKVVYLPRVMSDAELATRSA